MAQVELNKHYAVRRADIAAEAEEILRLWLATYPEMDPVAARRKLESQYLNAPAGAGTCLLLEHERSGSAVGVQCLGPRRFFYGETSVRAGIMADFVVDARHRSLGPALTLLKGTLSSGHGAYAFLYGFPNPRSEAVLRRVGTWVPGAITRFVRLFRSRSFLERRLGPAWHWLLPVLSGIGDMLLAADSTLRDLRMARCWRWSEQEDFDRFFDDCWQSGRQDNWLTSERSQETLSWRFPRDSARRISVATERASGSPEGYVVWRLDENAVEILDFFCREPEQQLAGMVASFAEQARKLGARSVGLEFAGPDSLYNAIRQAGFRARDQHPLFLSPNWEAAANSLPLKSMYLTGFDRD